MMMFFEPTPATSRALDSARNRALGEGAKAIAPRHLLLGLLDEVDGQAVILLESNGFKLSDWMATQTPKPPIASVGTLPYDPGVQRILSEAHDLARHSSEDRIVTTEHLLYAILRTQLEIVQELASFGLRFEDLNSRLETIDTPPLALDIQLDLEDTDERHNTARIVDASANRAREALRVLEDYCRFSLNDAFLSRQLKELRHDLAVALAELRPESLLTARDTLADVGTEITTASEQVRYSLRDVCAANLKRLQEALRSLEEYGKLYGSVLGQRLEKMRYRTYTLEQALLLGTHTRARLAEARLYVLLAGATSLAALDWTIAEAADGGADIVQLREKALSDRDFLERARDVRRWTRKAGVLFIVNDRPDIARLADADGVHLGQDDLALREARRVLGRDALIGVSTHNLDQVRRAVLEGASYIGVGPTFASQSKAFDELAGLEFVRAAMVETSLPAFVLGGVTAMNIEKVVAAGGRRVAVSAAVARAEDPRAAAAKLLAALP